MNIINNMTKWLSTLFVSHEEYYLSGSVDLADFERRQRIVERSKHHTYYQHMWY